jgi:hypothetical protein
MIARLAIALRERARIVKKPSEKAVLLEETARLAESAEASYSALWTCWLTEQLPLDDFNAFMRDDPNFAAYVERRRRQRATVEG